MIVNIFQVFFIFILILLFCILFGFPSLQTFFAKETFFTEQSKTYDDAEDNPAITICPMNRNSFGWKIANISAPPSKVFQTICNASANADEAYECINKESYKIDDIIVETDDNIIKKSSWIEDISFLIFGKCYTLDKSFIQIGASLESQLELNFNASVEYVFMIHDEDFFVLSANPETMPRILIRLHKNFGTQGVYMKVVRYAKKSMPERPCEDSTTYSLTRCIRSNFSLKIGCRPPWDTYSHNDIPLCRNMEQLGRFEQEFFELSLVDQDNIQNKTGCHLPCRYRQYKVAEEPSILSGDLSKRTVKLMYSKKMVKVKTEKLVYPFPSLLAEFGGSLGLFLGFSFMTVWDLIIGVRDGVIRIRFPDRMANST